MAPPGTEVRGFRVEIQHRKRGSVWVKWEIDPSPVAGAPQRAPFLRLLGWLRDDTVLTHPLKPRSIYDNLHAGLKAASTRQRLVQSFPSTTPKRRGRYRDAIRATEISAPTMPAFCVAEMRSFRNIRARTTVLAG